MHVEGIGGRNAPIPGGVWELVRQRNPWGGRGDNGAVATAWPELPEAVKAGIVAMVKAALPEPRENQ